MLRRIRKTATNASSTPIRIEPIASNAAMPVSWCRKMPAPASSRPTSAEKSSKNTARSVGFEVVVTKRNGCRPQRFAAPCTWRDAWRNEMPSSTKAMPSTM